MAYDPSASQIVLFGGWGATGATLGDTWSLTSAGWAQASPYAAPTPRSAGSAAYDSTLGGVVVFGGQNASGFYENQGYLWNAAAGTWESFFDNTIPSGRINASLAPAAVHGQLVLFGGQSYPNIVGDTQVLDWGHNGSSTADATFPVAIDSQASATVDLGTGNLYYRHQLWDIAATGVNSSGYSFYNSQSGYQFDSTFANIEIDPNGSVIVDNVAGTNGTLVFTAGANGSFAAPAGLDATMVHDASAGTYTMTMDRTQVSYVFSASSLGLQEIKGRNPGAEVDYSGGYVADDRGRSVNGVQSTSGSTQTMTWTDSGLGRTWVETGPAGGIVDTSITDANGARTTEAFDSNGQLTSITTPTGREIAIGYDNNNRVASITQVTDTANGTGPTTTLSYQPAPAGSGGQYQVVLTNPAGYSTTYLDAYGGQAIKVTDANGHTRSSTYTPDRNPASATDALGQVARLAYDLNNNLTKVTLPSSNGTNTAASTSLAYSTPTSVSGGAYLPSSLTDPQGNCSAFVYDPAGNLTASYAGQAGACSGDTAGVASTATYQGDAASGGGTVSCGAQPGEACSTTNANGATTTYGYDSTGELSTISAPSPLGATTISYDADSRVTSVTDGNGATTTYGYDANNDITKVSYPDGTSVSYTYNADGLVTSRTDATGTTTYAYDSRGLLGSETLPSGEVLSYTYDAAGNLASYTDAGGRVTYGYDPAGNLISLTDPTGALTHYSYDADNQLATVSYPDGLTQASSYNNAGQVTSSRGHRPLGHAGLAWLLLRRRLGGHLPAPERHQHRGGHHQLHLRQLGPPQRRDQPDQYLCLWL